MDSELSYGRDYRPLPVTSIDHKVKREVLDDLYSLTTHIVNVVFVGVRDQDNWVLVDAGMPGSAQTIIQTAESRFGVERKPAAIILTHGHFDHVGAIIELIQHWDVPVYAHAREMPYLTGKEKYKPDPTVEGGVVAKMSGMFPVEPIQLGRYVHLLPADGSIPGLPEWRWIHTPGHTPGHVSLFRERDRALIAGDAFVTVKQDELYQVLTQTEEVNGPPRYLTPDWDAAADSVRSLAAMNPAVAITGHGKPVAGHELATGLQRLADEFAHVAKPDYGQFVKS